MSPLRVTSDERRVTESFMRRAIELALKGRGRTSPNPMVGAVIVKGGKIVGAGFHKKAGTLHAEIHALKTAGRRARDADLYVTLEPCAHTGRTPPCVPAIVKAGIKRVIIGTRDPNPLVNGAGIRALKKTGIKVIEGVFKDAAREINEPYNKFIVSTIPHVTAKVALSLDGKIAIASGDSKWITNEECRAYVHRLRGQADTVMIGGGTARNDDPRLGVRVSGWNGAEPKAIIVDERLNLPRSLKLFKRPRGRLIVVTTSRASQTMRRWIEKKGHMVLVCRSTADGRVFLPHMLGLLGALGISSILLEGGGELFANFFRLGLVDRVVACIAPKIIGGEGLNFLPGLSIKKISDAPTLQMVQIHTFGDNVVVEGSLRYERSHNSIDI